jgi:hypothetical protein
MRLPIVITTIMLAASLLPGEEKPEPFDAAIIPVKTLSGDSFNRLTHLLGAFNAKFVADDKLRTIVVYAPAEVIAKMRRVVEELDRLGSEAALGRNIEMTLAFLRCSTVGQSGAGPLPADLEPVAKQLRAATQYKNIQLWDIVPLRLQEGKETTNYFRLPGTVPGVPSANSTAQLRVRPEAVTRKESGRYVRIDPFRIDFKIPQAMGNPANPITSTQFSYLAVGLDTAGDFKEGQKTVLGKISGIDDENAIFVVISLKVLD